jgi:DNA-binding LacI/PurR family transcriptional regulator
LTERGYDMLVSRVDAEQLDAAASPFDTGRAIGVVLIGQWRHHDQLNQLAARQVPIVVWGAQLPSQLYPTVGGDNVKGGRLAAEHLVAQGRRRIAFFGDTDLPEVEQRHRGYCEALRAHGIEPDPRLHVPVSFMPSAGGEAVERLQAQGLEYDAIFACSDLLAMTAISALRSHGRIVPRDVAVVGYDDIELASYFDPPLTTVRQPMLEAGQGLVAALIGLIERRPVESLQLNTELIVRSSSR